MDHRGYRHIVHAGRARRVGIAEAVVAHQAVDTFGDSVNQHHRRQTIAMLDRERLLQAIVRGWHSKIVLHAKQKAYREKGKERR